MNIDLCIVAGRRPRLLERTLGSFHQNAFKFHNIKNIYVNIDPIFGSEADQTECMTILRRFFNDPVIFTPQTAGFSAAVKRLWSTTSAEYIFHLEDDWIALDSLDGRIFDHFLSNVKQVSFHSANQNWDINRKGNLHRGRKYYRCLGLKIPIRSYPKFTTSPSIIDGNFARSCAAIMDEAFDPEKQFYSGVNNALELHVEKFNNLIFSPNSHPVVEDIGRQWRDDRGIHKSIINAASQWSNIDAQK